MMLDRPELCHVFVFTPPQPPPPAGLVESFRRAHPGQGTANVCFCFDDSYLELLWVTDADEIGSPPIAATRLAERSQWQRTGACPFGIALRGAMPFDGWDWTPPYLPAGLAIPVAAMSAHPRQPFLFRSPGGARPDAWTDGRAGARQTAAGLTEVVGMRIDYPAGIAPAAEITALAETGFLDVTTEAAAWRLTLTVARRGGGTVEIALPA